MTPSEIRTAVPITTYVVVYILQTVMHPRWTFLLLIAVISQVLLMLWLRDRSRFFYGVRLHKKYVGFHLNGGRMGNQLFHLITGYGIARTLGRVHYIPHGGLREHVMRYLEQFKVVFPSLQHSYVLAENGTNQTMVHFAGSCCVYDNPVRLKNHTARHLLLNFIFGQNPRYFDQYLDDIRRLLQFSSTIRREGNYLIDAMKLPLRNMLCIHIRKGDFVVRNISTNVNQTLQAVDGISKRLGLSRFMIFGDDHVFMDSLAKQIIQYEEWDNDAGVISRFKEAMDLYISSQVCRAFLITAVTSTFGWWLAFFIPDQNSVYYVTDYRKHGDKKPSKELFL